VRQETKMLYWQKLKMVNGIDTTLKLKVATQSMTSDAAITRRKKAYKEKVS
jgi:hypothetical protein